MRKLLDCIELKLKSFFYRILENTSLTNDQVSIYRIFFGLYILIAPFKYSWLGNLPSGFYKPGVLTSAKLFNQLPSEIYFSILDFVVSLLAILIILGVKSRYCFLALFIIFILNNPFLYSLGKIDHDGVFYTLMVLMFSFTNSGTKYALLPDKAVKFQNLALAVFSLTLVFGFFTAGFEKAITWVDFDLSTTGVYAWFYPQYFNLHRQDLLADYFFYVPLWLGELMDYSAVIFEVLGIAFLLYSRKTWYLYLVMAAIFHLFNTLVFNINYMNHFIVFGLWLISPLLLRYKWLILLLIPPFFLDGIRIGVALWCFLLFVYFFYRTGWLLESEK